MRTVEETKTLIDCGLGKEPCDLCLENLKLVNVNSKEVYESKIYIKGKRIVSIDGDSGLEAKETVDCQGMYAVPGFIDSHMHFSSSMINPEAMAQAIVPQGTTTLCADFMEISNVTGCKVVDVMLENADKLPYHLMIEVPTRVPTAPGLETTGNIIDVGETQELLKYDRTVSLGEIAPAKILQYTDDNIEKIVSALNDGKIVNGHAIGCDYKQLNIYASAGVTDDHECVTFEEAWNRLKVGMYVFIREGSTERNEPMFVTEILKRGGSFENTCFCTDDKLVVDIENEGHINHNVNLAIKLGVDPITAISIASVNAAKHFRMNEDIGSIAPGRYADILLCPSIEEIHPQIVYVKGQKVFEKDVMPVQPIEHVYPEWIRDTVKLVRPITPEVFQVKAPEGKEEVKVRIPVCVDGQIINTAGTATLKVEDGLVQRDPSQDIMKFAIVERYGKNGNVGVYFVQNFTLKKGALAYSMSHNHQNICVIGENDEDMAIAVNCIKEMNGGLVTVLDGKVLSKMPLTIGGLISEALDAQTIVDQLTVMNETAKQTGCTLPAPFMTLSFIAHPAVPDLAPTDMGLVDVATQRFVPLFVEE
ncbi:MAG: adenine deaminase [Erysipelotrichaceae bacterium]|nr:adenine deaminase [Erysipelotrichaceae bacterium]